MIEIVSGTNRPDNNASRVAAVLNGLYAEIGTSARILDLREMPAEIFNPSSYAKKPESFLVFQKRVLEADGLHIVTPEYNGGFPGVLKYFIDMLKFPESFESRPVAFTGEAAGVWGAIRPVEQLQHIFGYRNAFVYPKRVFLDKIGEKLDKDGNITSDKHLAMLREQAAGFADFTKRLKGLAKTG